MASWVGLFSPKINSLNLIGTWFDDAVEFGSYAFPFFQRWVLWCYVIWDPGGHQFWTWKIGFVDDCPFPGGRILRFHVNLLILRGVFLNLSPQECFATARIKAIGLNATCFMCHEHLSCFWMWVWSTLSLVMASFYPIIPSYTIKNQSYNIIKRFNMGWHSIHETNIRCILLAPEWPCSSISP